MILMDGWMDGSKESVGVSSMHYLHGDTRGFPLDSSSSLRSDDSLGKHSVPL